MLGLRAAQDFGDREEFAPLNRFELKDESTFILTEKMRPQIEQKESSKEKPPCVCRATPLTSNSPASSTSGRFFITLTCQDNSPSGRLVTSRVNIFVRVRR